VSRKHAVCGVLCASIGEAKHAGGLGCGRQSIALRHRALQALTKHAMQCQTARCNTDYLRMLCVTEPRQQSAIPAAGFRHQPPWLRSHISLHATNLIKQMTCRHGSQGGLQCIRWCDVGCGLWDERVSKVGRQSGWPRPGRLPRPRGITVNKPTLWQ